ncbi:hypothetical protein U9M48_003334, partial [Paspalum notatum var. saurae]
SPNKNSAVSPMEMDMKGHKSKGCNEGCDICGSKNKAHVNSRVLKAWCFTITTLDQNGNRSSVGKRSDIPSSSSSSCSGSTSPAFVASPRFNLPSVSSSPLPAKCYLTPTSHVTYTPSCRDASPILKPLTRTRTPVARQLSFNMDRTHWTLELTQFFLNALVDECRAGNRPNTTLNRIGKDKVIKRLQDFTGRPWKWDPCKHKWDEFKKKWACWRRLIKLSGVIFHPKTKLINMPQEWWDQQIQANPIAKQFMHTRLEYEELLDEIFKNLDPVNIGPDELDGHEGGRAGAPTHYLDVDTSNDSDNDSQKQLPSPLPSQPVRSTSMGTSSKRRPSDPVASTAEFWEGFKKFHEDVSASKKQKVASSPSNQVVEDPEYDAFMLELLDEGVDPESDDYFMASVVLLDSCCQGAYCPLPTIKSKLAWTKKMFLCTKGQPPST